MMSPTPFSLPELNQLLIYLSRHSTQPSELAEFDVEMTVYSMNSIFANTNLSVTSPVSVKIQVRVTGLQALQHIFNRATNYEIKVHSFAWNAGGHTANISVDTREIHLKTDSVSFIELIRHTMTGCNVRRFTVDLKVN